MTRRQLLAAPATLVLSPAAATLIEPPQLDPEPIQDLAPTPEPVAYGTVTTYNPTTRQMTTRSLTKDEYFGLLP